MKLTLALKNGLLITMFGWICLPTLLHAEVLLPTGDITADVTKWSTPTFDSGSTGNISNFLDPQRGKVLQIAYNLGTGNFVNVESAKFPSMLDLTRAGNALRFEMAGTGLQNRLKVEIKDNTGQVYQSTTQTTRISAFVTVTLPLDKFTWAYGGDSTTAFAFNSVTEVGFTIVPDLGGAGTVTLDNLRVVTLGSAQAAELIVDDCENVLTNDLGGSLGNLNDAERNTVTASVVIPFSGNNSLQIINPSNATQDGGVFESISLGGNPGTPLNVTPYTHLSFYVRSQSTVIGDVRVALKDNANNETQLVVQNFLPNQRISTQEFERVLIPLTNFTSVNLEDLGQLTIFLPPSNTIYLDHVSFNSVTFSTKPDYLIDSMDTYYTQSSWKMLNSSGTTLALATVDVPADQGLQMQFVFTGGEDSGQYVKAYRNFGLNIRGDNSNAFRFEYNAASTNNISNNIEFKVIDGNDTTFIFKVRNVANTNGQWKTITIPYSDLSYFSGSNHQFDFTSLAKVAFAVSKDAVDPAGQGTLQIHKIEFIRLPDFTQANPSNRVIASLSIDNNPFAPDRNSVKSTATFTYVLTQSAKVRLKVYDLSGNTVSEMDGGTQMAGAHDLTWDGRSRSGLIVRNGLYLYQFSAEGENATQRMKNLIGVIR